MARAKRTDNKGRVLRTGEQQRSEDGRYLYRYTDLHGKKKTVYANTLVELREKEEDIHRDLQDGIETTDMTLNELFEIFMKTKTNLKETTRYNYCRRWRVSFEEDLGKKQITKIKQIHVITLISDWGKRGEAAGTIKLDLNILSAVFDIAVKSDMIRKNPCDGCSKHIKGTKRDRSALSREEQSVFMNFIKGEDKYCCYYPIFTFMLSTGLRVGETTGLRWSDVDLKRNVAKIRQQLIYTDYGNGYKFHIQDLKTEAGYRDIPLTEAARQSLIREKELDLMLGRECMRKEIDGISDFVFINREGKPYTNAGLNQELARMVNAHNKKHPEEIQLPRISCHILRHTACSRMAEAGINVKTLQYIMGHADVSTTLDVYTNLDFSTIQENMEEIQAKVLVG